VSDFVAWLATSDGQDFAHAVIFLLVALGNLVSYLAVRNLRREVRRHRPTEHSDRD
jgi:hypothetical protein